MNQVVLCVCMCQSSKCDDSQDKTVDARREIQRADVDVPPEAGFGVAPIRLASRPELGKEN